MIQNIQLFIAKNKLFTGKPPILVAVSGGVDSMVLLHILKELNIPINVAHCNFSLRGSESDADEKFIENYCKTHNIPFHCVQFETEKLAESNKLGIQETARNLRYEWFETKRKETDCHFIATAHHLDDNIETLLFKLSKGTGLKGLRGILPKNNKIVRPLLAVSKQEILDFQKENNIEFREDASNKSTKYSRNLIRQEVVPNLEKINPNLHKTFENHFGRFQDIDNLFSESIAFFKKQLIEEKEGNSYISIKKLLKYKGYKSLLHELLQPFNFTNDILEDAIESLNKTETKVFYSATHRLVSDRIFFIVSDLKNEKQNLIEIKRSAEKVKISCEKQLYLHHLPKAKLSKIIEKSNYAYLDADKLSFPLFLKKVTDGAYFYPFTSGKQKKKKVNKFFKDLKMSLPKKENTWILYSGEKIVWVVDYRIDNRFKITENTQNVLKIELK